MTIAEVAKQYGLTPDTLRYYERIGLLLPVRRTQGGIRDYSEADCKQVEYVKCMRAAGVSIETLVEYFVLLRQGTGTIPDLTPAGPLGKWSEGDIAYYLESGFTPDFDSVGGSMAEVQRNMAELPASDREAIAAYLRVVPSH